jgi:transposase InsO family protein
MMISEYTAWLRSATTKHGRPFQAGTVRDYAETARVLNRWMTGQGHDGDFTACDPALLNTFFAAYFAAHGRSGTNTRQRNLRHLFTWLEKTYGHPHPHTDALQRYSPVQTRPSTLAQEYTSAQFAELARDCQVTLSLGRTGQCWDNALAESFFASIKGELIDIQPWPTKTGARRAIVEYIGWYNGTRLHSALGYLSPAEFEATTAKKDLRQIA